MLLVGHYWGVHGGVEQCEHVGSHNGVTLVMDAFCGACQANSVGHNANFLQAVMSRGTLPLQTCRRFALNIPSNQPNWAGNTDVKCFFFTSMLRILIMSQRAPKPHVSVLPFDLTPVQYRSVFKCWFFKHTKQKRFFYSQKMSDRKFKYIWYMFGPPHDSSYCVRRVPRHYSRCPRPKINILIILNRCPTPKKLFN